MNKRTWKKRAIGPDAIREALRTSRSLGEAARKLDVDRTTLYRWLEADPDLKAPLRARDETARQIATSAQVLEPDAWAATIETEFVLTDTIRVLVDLARQALVIARDEHAKPTERLAAMGRFQSLLRELDFEPAEEQQENQSHEANGQATPQRHLRIVK